MKKVLVCGGSGFIGQNIIKFLQKKPYKIFATYNSKKPKGLDFVKWIKSDLTSIKDVRKTIQDYEIIIQSAAATSGAKEMIKNPLSLIGDNAVMNSLILKEAIKKKVGHFVFLSCSVMYHHSNKKLKESDYDPSKKLNKIYEGMALSKVYIENMSKFYSERSKTKFSVLRHTNIYGPYDKFENLKSHFMASTITKIRHSKKSITVWGNGEEKRDFLYVEDLCLAIECILKKQKKNFEILNISYGKTFSVKEIVKKIKEIYRKDIKIMFDKSKPTININISVDNTKIFNKYKWRPVNTIENGIKKTITWYSKNY
jgi:nucleoside-diphosphate-sugar epimerase